jgi:hypothetical protein
VQALLQHTPSGEQKLLLQSPFARQAAPGGNLPPQVLSIIRQVSPFVQCKFVVHVFRQLGVSLQT